MSWVKMTARSTTTVCLIGLVLFGFQCRRTRHTRKRPAPVAVEPEPLPLPPPPAPPPPPPVAVAPPEPDPAPQGMPSSYRKNAPVHKAVVRHRAPREESGACGSGPGERLTVRGVDLADVLNVRAKPDWTSEVLGTLPPTATGVIGTGERQKAGGSSWRKVRCRDLSGWVNERFLIGS
jgi:hypothetical protein